LKEEPTSSSSQKMEQDENANQISEWKDITQLMKEATGEMEVGQLVCRENFGLYEAMSALEIMDPKMDSGMNSEKVHSLQERLDLGTIPQDTALSIPNLIGIMDSLLSCETMWFLGNTLAQTLFTCLYLHNIPMLKNNFLLVFARLMMKNCEVLRLAAMKADVHEEEDFITHLFGMSLIDGSSEADAATMMKEVEELLLAKIKKAKGASDDANVSPLQSDSSKEEEYCEAVLARLRFTKGFYMIHLSFEKPQCKGLEQAQKYISYTKSQIEIIKKTLSLGVVPNGVFDTAISRRLQSPTPSRIIPVIPTEEALVTLSKLLNNYEELCTITKCTTVPLMQKFFFQFVENSPIILARTRLMNLFYARGQRLVFGSIPIVEFVSESMKTFAIPSAYMNHPKTKLFLDKLALATAESFRVLCYNKARQRRKLQRNFDDWAGVQLEASELDELFAEELQSPDYQKARYFSCWVLDQVAHLMVHYLRLGFELDLYHPEEFPAIYWYLDYLFGILFQNQMFVKQLEMDNQQLLKKSGKKKKQKKGPKATAKKMKKANPGFQQFVIEANIAMCRGLFRFMFSTLVHLNQTFPSFPHGSDELRFYHRFAPFHKLSQPQPLIFNHYKENTNVSNVKPEQLFEMSAESLRQCKLSIETALHMTTPELDEKAQAELKVLAKVCISNLVQIQMISSKPAPPNKTIKYDFSLHSAYPVISLQPKTV